MRYALGCALVALGIASTAVALTAVPAARRAPEAAVPRPRAPLVVLQPGEQRPGDAEVMRHLPLLDDWELLDMLDWLADEPASGAAPRP